MIVRWYRRSAQIYKNIRSPFPDLGFIEGQTNCFKKRSEKLFTFSKTFEIFYKLFFQAAIIIDPIWWYPSPKISFSGGHQRVWDGNMGDVLGFCVGIVTLRWWNLHRSMGTMRQWFIALCKLVGRPGCQKLCYITSNQSVSQILIKSPLSCTCQ